MVNKFLMAVLIFCSICFSAITGYWYLTPTGDGTKIGTSLANAFDIDSLKKYIENGTVANGAVVFIWGGSYTFNAIINFSASSDGTAVNPVKFIGVKSATTNEGAAVVYSDFAIDTADMPLWNIGDYQFFTGDYTRIENVKAKGTTGSFISMGSNCSVFNCLLNNTYSTPAARYSLQMGNNGSVINCYIFSDSCYGISNGGNSPRVEGNYFYVPHETFGRSLSLGGTGSICRNNVFDRSGNTAIYIGGNVHVEISNNTFHKCLNDVYGTDTYDLVAINNIHDSTVRVCYRLTTQSDINIFRNNAFGATIPADSQYVNIDVATTHQDYWKKSGALYLDSLFRITDTNSVAYRAGYIGR